MMAHRRSVWVVAVAVAHARLVSGASSSICDLPCYVVQSTVPCDPAVCPPCRAPGTSTGTATCYAELNGSCVFPNFSTTRCTTPSTSQSPETTSTPTKAPTTAQGDIDPSTSSGTTRSPSTALAPTTTNQVASSTPPAPTMPDADGRSTASSTSPQSTTQPSAQQASSTAFFSTTGGIAVLSVLFLLLVAIILLLFLLYRRRGRKESSRDDSAFTPSSSVISFQYYGAQRPADKNEEKDNALVGMEDGPRKTLTRESTGGDRMSAGVAPSVASRQSITLAQRIEELRLARGGSISTQLSSDADAPFRRNNTTASSDIGGRSLPESGSSLLWGAKSKHEGGQPNRHSMTSFTVDHIFSPTSHQQSDQSIDPEAPSVDPDQESFDTSRARHRADSSETVEL